MGQQVKNAKEHKLLEILAQLEAVLANVSSVSIFRKENRQSTIKRFRAGSISI